MKELKLVKAIVRYCPSVTWNRRIVYEHPSKNDPTRYLLMQKAIDAYFPENIGKWECVGGIIKPGETSIEVITRKMTEETGLKRDKFEIVKQLPTLRSRESVCDVYLINAASMTIKFSKEHSDFCWKKAEDVKNMPLVLYADLLLEFFNNPKKYFN
jgi:8-oxo-dGTP pyrophosphatase MutT (NUDIX family)